MKKIMAWMVVAMCILSCSPSSKVTSSWKKPKFKGSYSDVVVVAMTPTVDAKTRIEDDLTTALESRGIVTSKGMDLFPVNFTKETDKEEIMRKIRHSTARAIVTVSLIHKETSNRYVPGSYGYAPGYTYYGRFWGYYSFWYPTIYSPGYYTQDNIYYMETNVYDVTSEELVWSAQSESYNPADMSGFSSELANVLSDKLLKDGILKSRNKGINPPDNDDMTSKKIKN